MASVIVTADDLGIHPAINRGIVEAFQSGMLTSASFMATTPYFDETVKRAILPNDLPVGIHLSLTYGHSAAAPNLVPNLVDETGRFNRSASGYILRRASSATYEQIRREFDAQIGRVRECGVKPTHLDSHQHVHMNPIIFGIVEDLALRHGICALRLVREPFFPFELHHRFLTNLVRLNPLKVMLLQRRAMRIRTQLATNDAFFGVMFSGNVDKSGLIAFLEAITNDQRIWELGLHPGRRVEPTAREPDGSSIHPFVKSPWREAELELLLDRELKEFVAERKISLISFRHLGAAAPPP